MVWRVVYEVDWRDAFTSLGAVDLDSVGSSFTFQGITWKTPSVARGNPFDQEPSTTWALEAGGLHCVSPDNTRFTTTNNNAPHIFAFLDEVAANTATPFSADPTRQYLLQGFLSDFTNEPVVNSGAYVAVYKVTNTPTGVAANFCASAVGERGGVPPVNFGMAGPGVAPDGYSRLDLGNGADVPVLSVHYIANRCGTYASAFGAGAFLPNSSLRFEAAQKDITEFAPDVVMDPEFFRLAPVVNNASNNSPNAYDATFQRMRLLQSE